MKNSMIIGVLILATVGCEGRVTESDPPIVTLDTQLRQSISQWGVVPIGAMPAQDPNMVALGRALFFDKILSGNRDISCSTCHQPALAMTDGMSLPVGTGGTGHGLARTPGAGRTFISRQSPSLLNAGLGLFYAFWDGRLTRGLVAIPKFPGGDPPLPNQDNILAAQAMLPVLNRAEMRGKPGDVDVFGKPNDLAGFTDDQYLAVWDALMARLRAIPEYVSLMAAAFPAKSVSTVRFEDVARAIAAFQMESLTKTRSPFDRYLDRDNSALTAQEKRGADLFFNQARCASCHGGPFIGGQSFANDGVPQIGPGSLNHAPLDLGRAEVENNDFYKFAFRVAPLRNIELTAPYMHNGAFPTLEAVLDHYNDVTLSLRTYDPSLLPPALRALYRGDQTTINAVQATIDARLRGGLHLTDQQKLDIIAFLKSLTDPSARNLVNLVPQRVPSGLPVD